MTDPMPTILDILQPNRRQPMSSIAEYDRLRDQALTCRREATYLRDLHKTATCGLGMTYPWHYGTREVPQHIAQRVSDCYLVWADEYEARAVELEAAMNAMLAGSSQ